MSRPVESISKGYRDKVPEIGRFKSTEMYSITVKEAGSVKSGGPLGWFLLETLRENQSHTCP